jgi:hypothetical protein
VETGPTSSSTRGSSSVSGTSVAELGRPGGVKSEMTLAAIELASSGAIAA